MGKWRGTSETLLQLPLRRIVNGYSLRYPNANVPRYTDLFDNL